MTTETVDTPYCFLARMDEVEDYMNHIYGLSPLQVNANYIGKGGYALAYRHHVHADRVLKFTTCQATIEFKQIQMSVCDDDWLFLPTLFNLTQVTEQMWLIEEEYLPDPVIDDKWINFILPWCTSYALDMHKIYAHIEYSDLSVVQKDQCRKVFFYLELVLQKDKAFVLDLCGFNFKMRGDQLVILDPIATRK